MEGAWRPACRVLSTASTRSAVANLRDPPYQSFYHSRQNPAEEAAKFKLLPEGGDHSERVFGDAGLVPEGLWPEPVVRHHASRAAPVLPPEMGPVPVTIGPGVFDDGGVSYDSLIVGLPSVAEFFRGRNVAMHRVVRTLC